MNPNLHPVIGVDLGTTYSAVAVFDRYQEKAVVLPNLETPVARSPLTTPSVIGMDPTSRRVIVGYPAKDNLPRDPLNTIMEIKREMGENCREDSEKGPGNLHLYGARDYYEEHRREHPQVPFHVRFDGRWFRPQEISAFTLMKMKEVAEAALGGEVINAIITVPAYFHEPQKSATREAALLAGLYPLKLVPEPTAAAICYGVDRMEETRKVYLVYDLGGGTFDVSIITVEEQNIDVIATSGDPRLGGGDFDDVITAWALEELKKRYPGDLSNDPRLKAVVKLNAEQTKIDLSTYERATLNLMQLWPENPPVLELSRAEFERRIDPLLNKSLSYVDKAIAAAQKRNIHRGDIDAVLLVGGSSKIPRVRARLLEHFEKGEDFLRADLDPDAVVARGAAILACRHEPLLGPFDIARKLDSLPAGLMTEQVADVRLITEHSLSVGIQNDSVSTIIDQGTHIPASVTKGGYTNPEGATDLQVVVYQGEERRASQNTAIGVLHLGPMEPRPENYHQFEVTFTLDENGLLTLTVFHKNENKKYQAKFDQKTGVPESDMKTVSNKLHQMYAGPAQRAPIPPPPAPPGYGAGDTGSGPRPQPAGAASAGTPPQPAASVQPTTPGQTSAVRPGRPTAGPEAECEIPAEFKRTVSSAQELLAKWPVPDLQQALDRFLMALKHGGGDGVLADLGDSLADVLDEAQRKPAGPLQPTREIPSEYRQLVRRAQKQLLRDPNPRLLEALNAFTALVNREVAEHELVEPSNRLASVFDEVRQGTPS